MLRKPKPIRPFRPPDAAEIETFLDYLAGLMTRNPREAHLAMPIWRALQRELKLAQETEAVMAEARARLARSTDRTEARFS